MPYGIAPAWQTESHLALIRDWFFPDHAVADPYSPPMSDMRQRAIDRVNVWRFKAVKLPHPLLATAELTEANLHDERNSQNQILSQAALKALYSMAFIRFVNGFVDRDVAKSSLMIFQSEKAEASTNGRGDDGSSSLTEFSSSSTKAAGENSMYAYAERIGLPEAFVDLRHSVSHHGGMPDLEYLRDMNRKALLWLWERWWVKNITGDPGPAIREIEARAEACLRAREKREAAPL